MNHLKYLLAALAFVLPVAVTPPAGAALATGVSHETIFSLPHATTSGVDYRVHERIVQLINGVPSGERIYFTAWDLTYVRIADALLAAHKRGVIVHGVQNGARPTSTQSARVRTLLGDRYRVCSRACLSSHSPAYMHSKTWIFSRTGTAQHVVLNGSTNATNHGNESNDAFIVKGDPDYYAGNVRVFDDMYHQRKHPNYMTTANGTLRTPKSQTTTYFSGRLNSTGGTYVETSTDRSTQAATDPYVAGLRKFTGGAGCSLKTAHRYWNTERDLVTDELVRIRKAGCAVTVISDNIDGPTIRALQAVGVDVRGTRRTRADGKTVLIHHKWMILEGTISGVAGSREVWEGSGNLVNSSLRYADDTITRIKHSPTVTQYETAFDRLYPYSYKKIP